MKNGVCTDHSCVLWRSEVLPRLGPRPANTLVVLRISSGSRGRDYSLPLSSIHFTCLRLAVLPPKWHQAAAQEPLNGCRMPSKFTLRFHGAKTCSFFHNFENKNISRPQIYCLKSKIEAHGSHITWGEAKSLTLSTWLYYFWKMSLTTRWTHYG